VLVRPHPEWSLYAAVGPGLTDGIASPDIRVVAGVRFGRRVPGRDRYTDSDNDDVPDYRDDCPQIQEDYDGFEDEDGCPELDNDHDGIVDTIDECPVHAEEEGGDGDGCPDHGKVMIRNGKLIIFGKIQFKTGSHEPLDKSEELLDQIGETLKQNPDVGPIRIEGHTDNVGDAQLNLTLSQKRADAVKEELVDRGVPTEILSTRGFGESKPIAPNKTAAGRARNRRVEFVVLRD
jgi:outer membrane protein OmpA-like peptidoglycan-associated protein